MNDPISGTLNILLILLGLFGLYIWLYSMEFPEKYELDKINHEIIELGADKDMSVDVRFEKAEALLARIEQLEEKNENLPEKRKIDPKKLSKSKDRCQTIMTESQALFKALMAE